MEIIYCDAQIWLHTEQDVAAFGFTLLFFLAWRLASSRSSRCSSKDLTPDTVHWLQAVRYAARASSKSVTGMLQARMDFLRESLYRLAGRSCFLVPLTSSV